MTLTAGGPYTLIMFAGLALAPASHGAVIIPGATPVVSTVLVWLWFGERPWPTLLAGLALVVIGLVLVGWPGVSGAAGERAWLGDLLFLVAGALWGLFTSSNFSGSTGLTRCRSKPAFRSDDGSRVG